MHALLLQRKSKNINVALETTNNQVCSLATPATSGGEVGYNNRGKISYSSKPHRSHHVPTYSGLDNHLESITSRSVWVYGENHPVWQQLAWENIGQVPSCIPLCTSLHHWTSVGMICSSLWLSGDISRSTETQLWICFLYIQIVKYVYQNEVGKWEHTIDLLEAPASIYPILSSMDFPNGSNVPLETVRHSPGYDTFKGSEVSTNGIERMLTIDVS